MANLDMALDWTGDKIQLVFCVEPASGTVFVFNSELNLYC